MALLEVKDLHVAIEGKEILRGVGLKLETGKVNALMGPNGSGKSTLANALMGNPKYTITKGKILFKGEDITDLAPDERAKRGLFLSFQYPSEIPGVTIPSFLRAALSSVKGRKYTVMEFKKILDEKMKALSMKPEFVKRYLNDGFSGGEKKRAEILQLLTLEPTLAILDETDSGLDIDALRIVAAGVNTFMDLKKETKEDRCVLIITHYKRILEYVKPDRLVIMVDGQIKMEGTGELVDQLEAKGYGWINEDPAQNVQQKK